MSIDENPHLKLKLFDGIFFHKFHFKNGCKKDLSIIMKNNIADPEIGGFFTKSISKPYGHVTAMPTA